MSRDRVEFRRFVASVAAYLKDSDRKALTDAVNRAKMYLRATEPVVTTGAPDRPETGRPR
jgi:hypothetical protein